MASAAARKKYNTPGVINGSLAYDFGALERQLEDTGYMEPDLYAAPMEETAADVISRAHESTKAKVRPAERVSAVMVAGFAAVAVMMVMMVASYVQLNTVSNSIVSLRAQAAALENEQVRLMTEYEQAFDLSGVKEAALAAGMSTPSDSQIYYIDLSDPDSAVVFAQEETGVSAVLADVGHAVGTVVEYFS